MSSRCFIRRWWDEVTNWSKDAVMKQDCFQSTIILSYHVRDRTKTIVYLSWSRKTDYYFEDRRPGDKKRLRKDSCSFLDVIHLGNHHYDSLNIIFLLMCNNFPVRNNNQKKEHSRLQQLFAGSRTLRSNRPNKKCVIFKCYSSEKLIALNTLHGVVSTWYSFHS